MDSSRLERLGKVQFFPVGEDRPALLNVNLCALLLKPRQGAEDAESIWNKYKARLICDLLKGGVNELLPKWTVHYGTVDLAISRMTSGGFLYVIDLADAFHTSGRRRHVAPGVLLSPASAVWALFVLPFRVEQCSGSQRRFGEGNPAAFTGRARGYAHRFRRRFA